MPNSVGQLINILVFVFTVALAYVILILFMTIPSENAVTDATARFVNECQTTGRIDTENLREYSMTVYTQGYQIEITHDSLKSYPDEDGGYFDDYYGYTFDDIKEVMYAGANEEDYIMKNGDILTVRVIRSANKLTTIVNNLFHTDLKGSEVTRFSGTIGNSNEN